MQYKSVLSTDDMTKSKSAGKGTDTNDERKEPTVYSQTFLDKLDDRGILDHRLRTDGDGSSFERPSNYDQIRSAIVQDRPQDKPDRVSYKKYTALALAVSNEAEQKRLYDAFFGTHDLITVPHIEQTNQKWKNHTPITGQADPAECKQAPWPDMAEGLKTSIVPYWIRKRLKGYVLPRAQLAFPNFLVELKRDKSMFTAHVQNRHCGAVASQGYVEYFVQIKGKPEDAWNIARVGSIEFNGDVVVGNIHWTSSSDETDQDQACRQYHMTRVMSRFTYGLDFEDFIIARKEARNFRDYFLKARERFLEDCQKLSPSETETSSLSRQGSERLPASSSSTVTGQPDAPGPGGNEIGRSSNDQAGKRRGDTQAPAKEIGGVRKKTKKGKGKESLEISGTTGLSQPTESFRIDD
jgi:hypothetical protein